MKKSKERAKFFVMGVLFTIVLSIGVVATANTLTREITYGIRVNLNGQLLRFATDSQPFVMEGRTFLPVRALAEILGLPVDFDPVTNTAYLGNRFARQRLPLTLIVPAHDSGRVGSNSTQVRTLDSANMGGSQFSNVMTYAQIGGNTSPTTVFSLHNLDGQYKMLTGHIGRVDGSSMRNATFNVIGDGVLLQTHDLRSGDLPTEISVFVEGVRLLRIEFEFRGQSTYALAAFLE
ncbi:MAG: hypothetical protein LBE35_01675 [Clostridiales bacterium]|jgi:hypothetical protein|nr:hypothetical protein [Clostridiales bacterium]